MTKYRIQCTITYTEYRYLEADSKEIAIDTAMDKGEWEKEYDEEADNIFAEEVTDKEWGDYHD